MAKAKVKTMYFELLKRSRTNPDSGETEYYWQAGSFTKLYDQNLVFVEVGNKAIVVLTFQNQSLISELEQLDEYIGDTIDTVMFKSMDGELALDPGRIGWKYMYNVFWMDGDEVKVTTRKKWEDAGSPPYFRVSRIKKISGED